MKKIFLLAFFLFSVFSDAHAEKNVSYAFTDSFLTAVKNCSRHTEDLTQTNPFLKGWARFFEADDLSVFVRIQGKNDKGECDFSVFAETAGETVSKTTCHISPEQQTELYNEMSGAKVETVWEKISENACERTDKEFFKQKQNPPLALKESFVEKLRSCIPAETTIAVADYSIEVTGFKDFKCQIKLPPFDLSLTLPQLQRINTLLDLYVPAGDPSSARYTPEYPAIGLADALKTCAEKKKEYDKDQGSLDFDTFKLTQRLSSAYDNGICTVKFINVLERAGQTTDYTKTCPIPEKKLKKLLPAKQKENDAFVSFKTNKELYDKIQKMKFCH